MNLKMATFGALVLLSNGCKNPASLAPLPPHYDVSSPSQVPIILLGQVISDAHPVAKPETSEWDGQPVRLYEVRVNVEAILRGDLDEKEVSIFYFSNLGAGESSVARVIGDLYAGHSELFFLQKDSGKLRTVCDGWRNCTYWVRSGSHYKLDLNRPLEDIIASVFLSRGDKASDAQMFDAIEHVEPRWGCRPIYDALQRLAEQDTSQAVRAKAHDAIVGLNQYMGCVPNGKANREKQLMEPSAN